MSENPIRLVLPTPVSVNRYWRTRVMKGVAVTYVSAEAKAYKALVASKAMLVGAKAIDGAVSVHVVLCPELTKKGEASKTRLDLDNCLKVALDALQGIAFSNDKQVVKLIAELGPAQVGGALMVEVTQA